MNQYLEYSLLAPTLSKVQLEEALSVVAHHQFFSICVPPFWVEKAKRDLGGTPTQVTTVIGYPLGYQRTATKRKEMEVAFQDGADEVALSLSLSAFKSGAYDWVKIEIAQLAQYAHSLQKFITIDLNNSFLNQEELYLVTRLCKDAGADSIKISIAPDFITSGLAWLKDFKSFLLPALSLQVNCALLTQLQAEQLISIGIDRLGIDHLPENFLYLS